MSKGRKRRYEEERAARKWVLMYIDTYSWDEPAIVSDPMPYDKALRALNKAQEQEDSAEFGYYELQQVTDRKDQKC
jgi:hypothetical protein